MKLPVACVVVGFSSLVLLLTPLTAAQTATPTVSALPRLVRFGGTVKDLNGGPLTGVVGITFALYSEKTGGSPLWLETQNATADRTGHYTVLLGSTKSEGLPADLFTSEQARWVGVQVSGQPEQPRVLLVSAPYALKAGDAETIGGLPPSAFVLAAPASSGGAVPASDIATTSTSGSAVPLASSDVTTTGGTLYAIPMFSTATNIQNSILTQAGTTINISGRLTLPTTGTATASKGFNSRVQDFVASVFNSSTETPVPQTFQWQAEPLNNNQTTATGTLNLLYATGTATPAETGLKISDKGVLSFAAGQTFPDTGTLMGVTTASGSGLSGGGTTGTLSLSLIKTCTASQILQWNGSDWACSSVGTGTITGVTAGTDLTGGGLGGNVTLNVDTSKLPQLAGGNTFTGNQTVNGNLSATGVVTGSGFQIGSNLFAFGSYTNGNAFLGFAGNSTMTGGWNTATGDAALAGNTSGTYNTANGYFALESNTTGSYNTAMGGYALQNASTASYNVAIGYQALFTNGTGSNNVAIGFYTLDNSIAGTNNTAIGTAALMSELNSSGSYNTATGGSALADNYSGNYNTANGYFALQSNHEGSDNTALGYNAGPDSASTALNYSTAIGAGAVVSQSNALVLGGPLGSGANVSVGIGTATPTNVFTIAQTAGQAISDGWTTYSSRRWKTNIQPLHNALGMVDQLRGVSYVLKGSGKHEIGVIAEEVGKVVPEVVSYEENGKDARGVDYSRLTALLIEAVKQQQHEIRELKSQLRATRQTLQKVQAQVASTQPALVAAK
jgi:hypothetical protein